MRRSILIVASLIGLSWAGPALTQPFPTRPISLVVPAPPGGIVDATARMVADPMGRLLAQPVVVDNRGGASGNIGYAHVARATPDGYTLLTSYSAFHLANPVLMSGLNWAHKDFAPIGMVAVATNVIAVHPSVRAETLGELIELLKREPNKLNYASQGNGSLAHIGTELFKLQTSTQMLHVPYRGSGPAMQDLLAGQVQLFITTPPSAMQHVQSGKLRGLAITGKNRHPGLPAVPTTAEAGLAGFELEGWVALFAPAATPADALARLTSALRESLEQDDTRKRAAAAGVEIRFMGPEALASLVRSESESWTRVIRTANIRAD
ncbi:MAG: tripartite tricarboxylate transporter substrate binding protein [Betaproteobacteria bacterium]|nr:tripartite tricarboxylate transporter substrate binding protein [Betaproteobacteria bacterium]